MYKLLLIFCLLTGYFSIAQTNTGGGYNLDSIRQSTKNVKANKTIRAQLKVDSLGNKIRKRIDSATIDTMARGLLALTDSLRKDSISKAATLQKAIPSSVDTSTYAALMQHPLLPFGKPSTYFMSNERNWPSKDSLFYTLVGVLFLLAFIKFIFPKYFLNLFRLFYQTSFRQKQTQDQLLQSNLASILMNVLFVVSGGLFIALLASNTKNMHLNFWWLLLYSSILLGSIYLVKYLFLLFAGWLFNAKEAASSYIFIVFLINKILGVILIPFLLLLAFSSTIVVQVAITVSLILVGLLLAYRYVVSLGSIRNGLKVNAFHFFLYLCAVEVLPLLLLYKALFIFAENHF